MAETKAKDKPTTTGTTEPDLASLEGKVVDEEQEITQPAATHEAILVAQEEQKRAHDVEHLVQTRAGERRIWSGIPPVPAGVYVTLPPEMWPERQGEIHRGHAQQVHQVRAFPDGPPLIIVVCDCGGETSFVWEGSNIDTICFPAPSTLEEAREVPEEFAEPAPRNQVDNDLERTADLR